MIIEISQNAAGVPAPQPKGGSGSINPVQEQSAVKASKLARLSETEKVEPTGLPQTAVVDKKEVEKVVDDLNNFAQSVNRQLQFSVDKDSGKTIVKVTDAETGETIRDIPSEEILEMQKHLKETSERLFQQEGTGASLLFQGKA